MTHPSAGTATTNLGPTANGGSDHTPPGQIAATLTTLAARLREDQKTNIGFPGSFDFDITPLLEFFNFLINNIGDPYLGSAYPANTMPMEREVVTTIANLLGAPVDDRWGYVTTGGTEGNEFGLHLARERFPDAMTYFSRAAHYSVAKSVARLRMPAIEIKCDRDGVLSYTDLRRLLLAHRDRPAIVLATAGTTMTEAVDDVHQIRTILHDVPIRRFHIHTDAALSGLPLAFVPRSERAGYRLDEGADSISVSGHKFIGCPFPSGVVVTRRSLRDRIGTAVDYIGSADTTVTGSRSGHAALVLWYALNTLGMSGLRRRADEARQVATYAHAQLQAINWPALRHPHAFTVVFDQPAPAVVKKWRLGTGEGRSHLVAMPGVRTDQIDALISDLVASRNKAQTSTPVPDRAPVPPRAPYPRDGSEL